jgi:hypothetical protein
MPDRPRKSWARAWGKLAALTVLAALIVLLGRAVLPWDAMFPDFICYWTAGKVLASGQNPYDVELQTRTQREYGWDRETTGRGTYDFLPFYYPPWFGLLWVPAVPLGFQAARVAWFFLNVELTLISGYLLHRGVPGVPPRLPMVLAPVFAFSVACVLLGQTAIVVLFLVALAWRLLQQGRDRWAGVVLAWWTIKPQLTALLLLGVLLWLARQRRWGTVCAFAVSLAVLCLASTAILPSWPIRMWEAPRQTPSPTEYYPWIGNAWFLVLRAVGLRGWLLAVAYLAAALPFAAAVVRAALDRAAPLASVLAWGILAAFFVSPYARHYDFPVLLIPAVLLLHNRLPRLGGTALVLVLAVLPYVQLLLLVKYQPLYDASRKFLLESAFFWVPLLLAALWAVSRKALRQPSAHPPCPSGAERGGPTGQCSPGPLTGCDEA